jgi:hypothetical protein
VKSQLIWFTLCLLLLVFYSVCIVFFDETRAQRLFSLTLIIAETIFVVNSWRKLTCEKSKNS